MAEPRSRFIKTVPFGGYDRTDVDKRLEALYQQVYDLKNELRETKLTLDKLKKGTEAEKTFESVLAVERAKLTEFQVKNETMSDKLKHAEEDSKNKEAEAFALLEENEKLKAALDDANSKLSAMTAGGDAAALGAVFIEAQKSRDLLINAAQEQAAKLKADSETLAENIITDADNKAATIIYEAEKRAAEIAAEALTKAEQMKVASTNLKASMLQEVEGIRSQVSALREAMETFEKEGFRMVSDSEQMLLDTEAELKKGGVPVFTVPGEIQPELPEQPALKPVDFSASSKEASEEETKKKNEGLDRLQAMAAAIGGGEQPKSGSTSLEALAQQAAALDSRKNDNQPKQQKSGSPSLADLAKQAQSIGGKSAEKTEASKKSGSPSLADLAKQAQSISGEGAPGKPVPPKKATVNLDDLAKQAEDALNKKKKK